MIDPHLLFGIISMLMLSAIFSGIEIAFVSSDKLHIELQKEKGRFGSNVIAYFSNRPSIFIGVLLVGNTLSLTFYAMFMTRALKGWLDGFIFSDNLEMLTETVISTIIVLFTAEFIPKSLFLINPHRMLFALSIPLQIIYWVLYIPVFLIVGFSKILITKVFRWEFSEDKPVFGLTDLNNYIQKIMARPGLSEEVDIDTDILANAMDFRTIQVRECMIPRIEINAIDVSDTVENLRKLFVKTGNSKILVYQDSIDNIIGYCHSSNLFRKPQEIDSIISSILVVPETRLAHELLIEFIDKRKSIALVVDEFGGTAGIVTMEDVIEEIFGEIKDEYDDVDLVESKLGENTYIFSARHEIDYLNEKYELEIPEGDYDTLGGVYIKCE